MTKEFDVEINGTKQKLTLAKPTTGDTNEWLRISIKKTKEIDTLKKDTKKKLLEKKEITESTDKKETDNLILGECIEQVMDINAELITKRCELVIKLSQNKPGYKVEDLVNNIAQNDRKAIFAWLDNEMGLVEDAKDKNF